MGGRGWLKKAGDGATKSDEECRAGYRRDWPVGGESRYRVSR